MTLGISEFTVPIEQYNLAVPVLLIKQRFDECPSITTCQQRFGSVEKNNFETWIHGAFSSTLEGMLLRVGRLIFSRIPYMQIAPIVWKCWSRLWSVLHPQLPWQVRIIWPRQSRIFKSSLALSDVSVRTKAWILEHDESIFSKIEMATVC